MSTLKLFGIISVLYNSLFTVKNNLFASKLTFAPVDIGMPPNLYVHILSKIKMNILPWNDVEINVDH